jgi:hypothetical protein
MPVAGRRPVKFGAAIEQRLQQRYLNTGPLRMDAGRD